MVVAAPTMSQALDCEPSTDPAVIKQAEQKLVLLQRLVGDTERSKRVSDSGNADAQIALDEARRNATQAALVLDEGCGTAAVEFATAGLNLASKAFSLARDRERQGDRSYRLVLERTTSFLQSLEAQPEEKRGIGAADIAGIRRQIGRAEELAVSGDYQAASELLKPVVDRLERRLVAIYDQTTVYYEKTFDGPADEYAYLTQQYRGYLMVFEQFSEGRQVPHSARQAYADALTSAAGLAASAAKHAEMSNWGPALEEMRDAVANCERAMRLIGIGY
jgi:hypothetical protein